MHLSFVINKLSATSLSHLFVNVVPSNHRITGEVTISTKQSSCLYACITKLSMKCLIIDMCATLYQLEVIAKNGTPQNSKHENLTHKI